MRRMTRPRTAWFVAGVTAAIVLTAVVMRSPLVAVAPVAREIQSDLGVSAAVVGLLTSIPVLAFAVCAPIAVVVIRRCGPDLALAVTLVGAAIGCLVRSAGDIVAVMIGTALIGFFLAIGNVVAPVIIRREFPPARVPFLTGVYTSAMNVGTMLATLVTAPLAAATDWRVATAAWGAFALAALATWLGTHGLRVLRPAPAAPAAGRDPLAGRGALRAPATWLLALAFAGQSFAFYAATAWLPSLLIDEGMAPTAAGAAASLFQVTGIAGALLLPLLVTRTSAAVAAVVLGTAWVVLPAGFLVAPDGWLAWCLVGGFAQGAGVTWVFLMFNALGGDDATVTTRTGAVQTVGYVAGASGALVLGSTFEATGGWTVPLIVLLGAALMLLISGWSAARSVPAGPARVPGGR